MIITALRAYNVLKYSQLQLDNLPEKGIIAISGNNESGKSSIGEILCFALFGRTFSLKPEALHKVIRWGEDNCSVSLNFKVEEQEYNLFRYLDDSDTHAAKLSLVGYEDTPLARSPEEVDAMVSNILGYNFEEFIESFYLAQREITSPHPHGKAVKTIAGMDALEQVSSDYEQDANTLKEKLRELSVEKAGRLD
jgi:exonuclease SbcC